MNSNAATPSFSVHSPRWASTPPRRRIFTRGGKVLFQVRTPFVAGSIGLLTGCTVTTTQWTPPCCAICRRIEVWTMLAFISACRRTARRWKEISLFQVSLLCMRTFILTLTRDGCTTYIQSFSFSCGSISTFFPVYGTYTLMHSLHTVSTYISHKCSFQHLLLRSSVELALLK